MTRDVRENEIEKYLTMKVKEAGGWTTKFTSVMRRGVPDRVVLFPHSGTTFVEVKRPGETLRAQQVLVIGQMQKYGASVYWVSTKEEVDDLILQLKGGDY